MLDFDTRYTQQRLDYLLKAVGAKECRPISRPDGLDHVRFAKVPEGSFVIDAPYIRSALDPSDWRSTPTVRDRYMRDIPCWLAGYVTYHVPCAASFWHPSTIIRLHATQRAIDKGLDLGAIAAKLCAVDLEQAGLGWHNFSQLTGAN